MSIHRNVFFRNICILLFYLASSYSARGQYENIKSGSYIIDMGDPNVSVATHLKPYGLIYDLVENFNVPVKWIIKPGKEKDSIDFTHNGRAYRGGPFIIPKGAITSEVDSVVNYWMSTEGVSIDTMISTDSLPVYFTITTFPTTVIDLDKGSLVQPFYTNAGIPSSSYRLGLPSDLSPCDGVYILPHADPTWANHSYLYDFVRDGGYIWVSCHAVSVLESITDTSTPPVQYNFLTSNGLQCYKNNNCGSISENHPGGPTTPIQIASGVGDDPVMQFLGNPEGAMANGSEKWYVPLSTGGWNTQAKKLVTTSDGSGSQQGVKMIYGYAYDDTSYGKVMYEAGHEHTKGPIEDQIAAQRAFWNFLLLTGEEQKIDLLIIDSTSIMSTYGDTFGVSVVSSKGAASFSWSANAPGTFSAPYESVTAFTPDSGLADSTIIVLTVNVSDTCGTASFESIFTLYRDPQALLPIKDFQAKYLSDNSILLKWSVVDPNPAYTYYIQRRSGSNGFFQNIASIGGDQASGGNLQYIDKNYPIGESVLYYRIMEESDGWIIDRSPIRSVKIEPHQSMELEVYPVPAKDKVSVRFVSHSNQAADIVIYDINGELVYSKSIQTVYNGSNEMNLYLDFLPRPAIYLLLLRQAGAPNAYAKIYLLDD